MCAYAGRGDVGALEFGTRDPGGFFRQTVSTVDLPRQKSRVAVGCVDVCGRNEDVSERDTGSDDDHENHSGTRERRLSTKTEPRAELKPGP